MLALVTGGAASGKSDYAERLLCSLASENRTYIATMQICDSECQARVEKHRVQRLKKGFLTLERPLGLMGLAIGRQSAVLLECLTTLTANELYEKDGEGEITAQAIVSGVLSLARTAEHLVVVTGEVFSDGGLYDSQTTRYLSTLAKINRAVAKSADLVVEVVCGIPLTRKGVAVSI